MLPLVLLLASIGARQTPSGWGEQILSPGVSVSAPGKLKPVDPHFKVAGFTSMNAWAAQTGFAELAVSITKIEAPDKQDTSTLFNAMIDATAPDTEAGVVSTRDMLVSGWPGLAATFRAKSGPVMALRLCRTTDAVVTLVAAYPGPDRPPEVDRFLDSLKIIGVGPLKKPGAELKAFPLGQSGLTAMFPRTPEAKQSTVGNGNFVGTMQTFASDYGMREYEIGLRDLPASLVDSEEHAAKLRDFMTTESLRGFRGTRKTSRDVMVGADRALETDFAVADRWPGKMLVYMHGKWVIVVLYFGPPGWSPESADAFLFSVKDAPSGGG